jgi:hypothetical protein
LAKILRGGVTKLNFDRKAELDFDKKKQNWMLTKKMHNYVLKKKGKKRKYFSEHRTYANRRLKPHPQNPNRRRYA